ncbi:MAG TPA: DUF1559 domain-containing protein [Planctomycetaceae bacterium]|nr:DUF1559 domain-containing protein [Planctomycetaceae bacterium]
MTQSESFWPWLLKWTAICLVCAFFGLLILQPVFQTAGSGRRRTPCRNNLHNIGIALHNYHDRFGSFPPAYVADKRGRPMHSWRVLILPWLGEEAAAVYSEYRFDEPWNGPNNRRLAERRPEFYRCPQDKRLKGGEDVLTAYQAISGPGCAFDADRARRIPEFQDGTSVSLMVVESPGTPVHWMQPVDVSADELLRSLPSVKDVPHQGGIMILMGDGAVRYLASNVPPETLRALTTIAGGDEPGEF